MGIEGSWLEVRMGRGGGKEGGVREEMGENRGPWWVLSYTRRVCIVRGAGFFGWGEGVWQPLHVLVFVMENRLFHNFLLYENLSLSFIL